MNEEKLLKLTGDKKANYTYFLVNALGVKPYKAYSVDIIHVDKQGFSPEIAEALQDENYLKNHVVIFSQKQKSYDLIGPSYSIANKLLDRVYDECSQLISDVSEKELLYGLFDVSINFQNEELEKKVGFNLTTALTKHVSKKELLFLEDNETSNPEGLYIQFHLNTVEDSVEKMKKSISAIESMIDSNHNCLDKKFLKELQKLYSPLYELYGNIRRFKDLPKGVSIEKETVIKYQDSKQKVFAIYNSKKKNVSIISFGDKIGVVNNSDFLKKNQKIRFASDENLGAILDVLVENGFMEFNKKAGENRMEEIEDNILIKYGHRLLREAEEIGLKEKKLLGEHLVNKQISRMERYRIFRRESDLRSELNDHWDLLKEVIYKDLSVNHLPLELKLPFIGDSTQNPLIKEIIAKIDPTNFVYTQRNDSENFKEYFKKADDDTKKMILTRFERTDDENLNPEVIEWLQMNFISLLPKKFKIEENISQYDRFSELEAVVDKLDLNKKRWGEA
ncbi:MAG: hypothetical protein ABIC91_05670 [Nanoarchaeota archaeon]|nr:hypothetical protein [Nanoarchaeota archaeon]MBU1030846.1 hypothetical protein [Nanoarchaeota archaeon]